MHFCNITAARVGRGGMVLRKDPECGTGAAKDHFMTHLAVWGAPESEWGDHVTDEEYDQQPEINS
ncbi:MAG: hypothetical protein AUH94_04685 [Ktedonobacter sp. 13_2_20CM_2_54_8]|nr:MAG: hypothetical protein AUH94_04685 [Ktedonobacter sp. 13_2_20CM_2_54_8]